VKPREKILEAADSLFGEVGFDATTTREIAERSGVNKALIHYHFKSKEGLLASLLDQYYRQLATTVQKALGGDATPETTLRERMHHLVEAYVDFLAANLNFARIVQREASGGQHMTRIRAHMAPLFTLGTQMVKELYPGARQGDLAAEHLLTSFYGMVISYFTFSDLLADLYGADPLSPELLGQRKAHLRRMLDLTLDALATVPQEAR
jgi:AcrR family transcriptional regulator